MIGDLLLEQREPRPIGLERDDAHGGVERADNARVNAPAGAHVDEDGGAYPAQGADETRKIAMLEPPCGNVESVAVAEIDDEVGAEIAAAHRANAERSLHDPPAPQWTDDTVPEQRARLPIQSEVDHGLPGRQTAARRLPGATATTVSRPCRKHNRAAGVG